MIWLWKRRKDSLERESNSTGKSMEVRKNIECVEVQKSFMVLRF